MWALAKARQQFKSQNPADSPSKPKFSPDQEAVMRSQVWIRDDVKVWKVAKMAGEVSTLCNSHSHPPSAPHAFPTRADD